MTRASDTAKLLGAGGSILGSLDVGGGQIGGRRNIIINGAMQVAQRGTSSTGLGANGDAFLLDRFRVTAASTAGRYTMTQTADGPSGFANCLKIACTTADTSIAAGENLVLVQGLEGQDLQQFKKGTSDAEKFTVSFYVKGHDAATYTFEMFDGDNTRQVSQTFSVTTDWTRVILTFPADTTGAFGDDNGASLYLQICLHAGSTFTSGTLNTSWASNTNANRYSSDQNSIFESTSATFFITGFQLEVGSVATPFEHRSFGEELALCQRYTYIIKQSNGQFTSINRFGMGITVNTTQVQLLLQHPVAMRAAPTLATSGTASDYNMYSGGYNVASSVVPVSAAGSQYNSRINFVAGSGLTVGQGAMGTMANTDAFLLLTSEL